MSPNVQTLKSIVAKRLGPHGTDLRAIRQEMNAAIEIHHAHRKTLREARLELVAACDILSSLRAKHDEERERTDEFASALASRFARARVAYAKASKDMETAVENFQRAQATSAEAECRALEMQKKYDMKMEEMLRELHAIITASTALNAVVVAENTD
jgi:hypothetical protein